VTTGEDGQCKGNIGPTTVGLMYVNPAGRNGESDLDGGIVDDIHSTFGEMDMNDIETVALIGGGHAFGKAHGACDSPPCGTGDMQGKGPNTFTSGFEGAWTQIPTTWSNLFFTNLFEFEWDLIEGPGGEHQWTPQAKNLQENAPDIFMLTSDLALRHDEKYRAISESYKNDLSYLDEQFMHSWYKLTTQDMGP